MYTFYVYCLMKFDKFIHLCQDTHIKMQNLFITLQDSSCPFILILSLPQLQALWANISHSRFLLPMWCMDLSEGPPVTLASSKVCIPLNVC